MITGKLNLAALKHVVFEQKGKSGMVKGIFIPIEANTLFEGKEGAVYLDLVAFEMKEKKDYATHIVKQNFSKEVREKMSDEEKSAQPILGNLNADSGAPREANNNPEPGAVFTPEKDLPF